MAVFKLRPLPPAHFRDVRERERERERERQRERERERESTSVNDLPTPSI